MSITLETIEEWKALAEVLLGISVRQSGAEETAGAIVNQLVGVTITGDEESKNIAIRILKLLAERYGLNADDWNNQLDELKNKLCDEIATEQ